MTLTPRQKRFVELFDGNATEAARADGTNINPNESPEEYAEALRQDFLNEYAERTNE